MVAEGISAILYFGRNNRKVSCLPLNNQEEVVNTTMVADSVATAQQRRRLESQQVCEQIKAAMAKVGWDYRPDQPYIWRHQQSGIVVKAENLRELQARLGLDDVSVTSFKQAVGRLMYKHGQLFRTHIAGKRHYKLLPAG